MDSKETLGLGTMSWEKHQSGCLQTGVLHLALPFGGWVTLSKSSARRGEWAGLPLPFSRDL